jgi:hypothetical protein
LKTINFARPNDRPATAALRCCSRLQFLEALYEAAGFARNGCFHPLGVSSKKTATEKKTHDRQCWDEVGMAGNVCAGQI